MRIRVHLSVSFLFFIVGSSFFGEIPSIALGQGNEAQQGLLNVRTLVESLNSPDTSSRLNASEALG